MIGNVISQAFARPALNRLFGSMEGRVLYGHLRVILPDGSSHEVKGPVRGSLM